MSSASSNSHFLAKVHVNISTTGFSLEQVYRGNGAIPRNLSFLIPSRNNKNNLVKQVDLSRGLILFHQYFY